MKRTYVYPKIGRAGLGNELFPVARAWDLIADSPDVEMLPPKWFGFRLGPYLRGDRDKRQYWRLFRSGPNSSRIARFLLINLGAASRAPFNRICEVQVVEGMDGYFERFRRPPEFYRKRLVRYARERALAASSIRQASVIGVHVRRGDFQVANEDSDLLTTNNAGTSNAWYAARMRDALVHLGDVQFVIASDGSDAELADLLKIPGTRRVAGNALEDILVLSQSAGLIGCRSTFTAWAAFLGDVPLLLPPGGNAYRPHHDVYEVGRVDTAELWTGKVAARLSRVRSRADSEGARDAVE